MSNNEKPERNQIARDINRAEAAYADQRFDKAAQLFEKARRGFKALHIKDNPQLRICLTRLSDCYVKQSKYEEALGIIKALRKIHDSMDYRRIYINLLSDKAKAHQAGKDQEAAVVAYSFAIAEAEALLPANDPLAQALQEASLEYFRETISARKNGETESEPEPEPVTISEKEALKIKDGAAFKASTVINERALSQNVWNYSSGGKGWLLLQSKLLPCGLALIIVLFVGKGLIILPGASVGNASRAVAERLKGQQFRSLDGKLTFVINDKNSCQVKSQGKIRFCHYKIIEGSVNDLLGLLRGYLNRSELWYQIADKTVSDPDKTLLYRSDAPELSVVKKMWWYADFAQKWYTQNHMYPGDAKVCAQSEADFVYLNPFTQKEDKAVIVSLKKNTGEDPGWSLRPTKRQKQPHWRPGGIYCINVDGNRFFINGCDRDGRPLTASDASHYFFIDCKDGVNVTSQNMRGADQQASTNFDEKPVLVVLFASPSQEALINYFRSFLCSLVWIWTIIAALWCFSSHRLKQPKILKRLSILALAVGFCGLAAWYYMALVGH